MITKLKITALDEPRENGIVGFATATFNDAITVNSISIRQKNDKTGYYVRMPMKKTADGQYIDAIHPINSVAREELNNTILSAFTSKNYVQEFPQQNANSNISAQNCVKYPIGKYGKAIGRVDVVVDDMVIHNCRLSVADSGEPALNMPSYKDKKGDYHSICVPHSKQVYQDIKLAAMQEYNTEYMYRDVSPQELEALKETDIPIKMREKNGVTAIKFDVNDRQRVENALKIAQVAQQTSSKIS